MPYTTIPRPTLQFNLYLLIFGTLLLQPTAASSTHDAYTNPQQTHDPSPNHLFRALISAGRQFPSSINHNGISFFPATVPAGTRLYHGRGSSHPVEHGLEWLAFEPEHATNFAVSVCFPDGEPERNMSGLGVGVEGGPDLAGSVRWWLNQQEVMSLGRSGMGEKSDAGDGECTCPDQPHDEQVDIGSMIRELDRDSRQQQQPLFNPSIETANSKPPKHRRPTPNFCLKPGHLHSYSPINDLHLLYIDGQSAAKSGLGTLASQDDILLRNSTFRPRTIMTDEPLRAMGLCDLAKNAWGGKVDGFVRMEHGFEVLLCDFGKVRFDGAVAKGMTGLRSSEGSAALQFWRAIAEDRGWGVGFGRLKLWTERWVSAYAVDGLDLWKNSPDGELPSLSEVDDEVARELREEAREAVVEAFSPSERVVDGRDATDWQAVADLYVTRYATRLQYLAGIDDAERLSNDTKAMLMVYENDMKQPDSRHAVNETIKRCTTAFIPTHLLNTPQHAQCTSQKAVIAVVHTICNTLHDLTQPPLSQDLPSQQRHLQHLMEYLRWPQWTHCNGHRGCEVDQVCFTAIWPWGDQGDHDAPHCLHERALQEKMVMGAEYWRMEEVDQFVQQV